MRRSTSGVRIGLLDEPEPRHGELRRLIQRGFTPSMVRTLQAAFQVILDVHVDRVLVAGRCDFVQDIAVPLPLILIAQMIGIHEEDDGRFHAWSDALVAADGNYDRPEIMERSTTAFVEYAAYVSEIIEDRREHPRDDLVSVLVGAKDAGTLGDRLDGDAVEAALANGDDPIVSEMPTDELIMYLVLILVAGNETTRNPMSGGMQLLIDNPSQCARLAGDLDLMPSAIEEMLRLTSPVHSFTRTVTRAIEFGGALMREGDDVLLLYPSANRDSAQFADPDTFLVDRELHSGRDVVHRTVTTLAAGGVSRRSGAIVESPIGSNVTVIAVGFDSFEGRKSTDTTRAHTPTPSSEAPVDVLRVGSATDPAEVEADRVAANVVRSIARARASVGPTVADSGATGDVARVQRSAHPVNVAPHGDSGADAGRIRRSPSTTVGGPTVTAPRIQASGGTDVIRRKISYTWAGWTSYTRWVEGAQTRWSNVQSSYTDLEREVTELESLGSVEDASAIAGLKQLVTDNDRQITFDEGAALEQSLPVAVGQARALIQAIEVQRKLKSHYDKLAATKNSVSSFMDDSGGDHNDVRELLDELDLMLVGSDVLRGERASARVDSASVNQARSVEIEASIRRAVQKSILESVAATYADLGQRTQNLLQKGKLSKAGASEPRKKAAKQVAAKLQQLDAPVEAAELKEIAAECTRIATAYSAAQKVADDADATRVLEDAETARLAKVASDKEAVRVDAENALKRSLGKYAKHLSALDHLADRDLLTKLAAATDGGTMLVCLPFAKTKLPDLLALTTSDHLKKLLPALGKDQEDDLIDLLQCVGAGGEDTLLSLLGVTPAGRASQLTEILRLFAPGDAGAQLALSVVGLGLTRGKQAEVLALLKQVQVGGAPLTAVEVAPLPPLLAKLGPEALAFCLGPDGGQTIATLNSQLVTHGEPVWTGAQQNEPAYFPGGTDWATLSGHTCPTQNPVNGRYCTRRYGNAQGSDTMLLPMFTGAGLAIVYTEWDIKPYNGPDRGVLRVVTDDRGRRYYTSDHYKSFRRFA